MADPTPQRTAADVMTHWTSGPGADLIKWDQPGAVDRCVAHITSTMASSGHPMPVGMVRGMCQNMALRYRGATDTSVSSAAAGMPDGSMPGPMGC